MRKLAFLSVLLGILTINSAYSDCQVLSCDDTDNMNGSVVINGNQCFFCGPGGKSCGGGDIVASINDHGEAIALWQCKRGNITAGTWYNKFVSYNTNTICPNSPIQKNNVPNTRFIYSLNGGKQLEGYQAGAALINVGSSSCRYITCTGKLVPSADKLTCIEPVKCSNGKAPGETWTADCSGSSWESVKLHGKTCGARCNSDGTHSIYAITCKDGYEGTDKWDVITSGGYKACTETQASRNARDRQRRENATKKEKCEDTGGAWSGSKCTCDATKNLKKQGDECVCLDDTYERAPDGKSCKLTDIEAKKKACESTEGAYWSDDKKRCLCDDKDSAWRGGKCVENTDIKRCKSATGTKWDYTNNECVCKDSTKEYDEDNNECIETDEARKKREEAEAAARKQAEQDAAKARITSITGKLDTLKAGLSTSVWKNKEGNFNTSRLVSDSVAGVVLGTAGGLITSNVIKKNQVKGGFEDISCTVRGQVVAGYGDDFQVGIQ